MNARRNARAVFLWLLYALFLVYATTLPFEFEPDPAAAAAMKLAHMPLNPFSGPTGGRASIPDMTQNVLLFMPFGVLGMFAMRPGRRSRRASAAAGRTLAAVVLITLLGALVSVSVEILQLFTTERTSSLNDVMTNTAGALLGGLAAAAVVELWSSASAIYGTIDLPAKSMFRLVSVAASLLVVAAWHPFDASLDVGGLVGKVRTFIGDPWQSGALGDEAVDWLRYAFFGGATAAWLRGARVSRPQGAAALLTVIVAVALELSQTIIGSRMPGVKDMVVGAAGGVSGALLESAVRRMSPAVQIVGVTAASWLATSVLALAPFTLRSAHEPMAWMPFRTYYQYTSGQTVSHVIELAMAFFPIGFVLLRVAGRSGWLGVAGMALPLAASLEYLQGWIVDRVPDITDVTVMTLGAILGAWVRASALPLSSESGTSNPGVHAQNVRT
jgi:glycopeptide antibiotics resistance protein